MLMLTCPAPILVFFFFFFNDTATTEIYTLSLHDALPICSAAFARSVCGSPGSVGARRDAMLARHPGAHPHFQRSEEHTSELQSRSDLVCRLLLEKKKTTLVPDTHPVVGTHRQRHHMLSAC